MYKLKFINICEIVGVFFYNIPVEIINENKLKINKHTYDIKRDRSILIRKFKIDEILLNTDKSAKIVSIYKSKSKFNVLYRFILINNVMPNELQHTELFKYYKELCTLKTDKITIDYDYEYYNKKNTIYKNIIHKKSKLLDLNNREHKYYRKLCMDIKNLKVHSKINDMIINNGTVKLFQYKFL